MTITHDGTPNNFWENYNNWDLAYYDIKLVDPTGKKIIEFHKSLSIRFTEQLREYRFDF